MRHAQVRMAKAGAMRDDSPVLLVAGVMVPMVPMTPFCPYSQEDGRLSFASCVWYRSIRSRRMPSGRGSLLPHMRRCILG